MGVRYRERITKVTPRTGVFRQHVESDFPRCNPSSLTDRSFPTGLRTDGRDTCQDVTGSLSSDNPLSLSHRTREGGVISGLKTCPYCGVEWGIAGSPIFDMWADFGHLDVTLPSPSWINIAARTTPNRPDVDLPVFVAELRDLPRLVQLGGRSLLGKVSSANLNYQFGWKPLLGDLSKLWEFKKYTDRKISNFEKLRKGVYKRKVSVGDGTANEHGKAILNSSAGIWLDGFQSRKTTAKRWATMRWKLAPGASLPVSGSSAEYNLAMRSVLGLDPSAITSVAWELIPFSWLADWYGTIGDYLMTTRNLIPVVPGSCCIMTQVETRTQLSVAKPAYGFISASAYIENYITKSRSVLSQSASIQAELPALSLGQLSILGSLSVLKAEAWGKRR